MNLLLSLIITQLFQVLKNKIYSKNNFFPTYIPLFLWSGGRKQECLFLALHEWFIYICFLHVTK